MAHSQVQTPIGKSVLPTFPQCIREAIRKKPDVIEPFHGVPGNLTEHPSLSVIFGIGPEPALSRKRVAEEEEVDDVETRSDEIAETEEAPRLHPEAGLLEKFPPGAVENSLAPPEGPAGDHPVIVSTFPVAGEEDLIRPHDDHTNPYTKARPRAFHHALSCWGPV